MKIIHKYQSYTPNPMISNLADLETLINLESLKSFSATAKKMNTTQSNVSKRILKMENDFEKKLIVGKRKGMRLTADGEIVVKYAKKMLKQRNHMLTELNSISKSIGHLTIGSSETILMLLLPDIINEFNKDYPSIQIDIQVDTSNNLRKKILNNEIDIAFLIDKTNGVNSKDTPLIQYNMGWFINKDLPKHNNFLDMLQHYPLITFSKDTPPFLNLVQALRHQEIKNHRIYHCASLYALVDLTINKTGIGIFPQAVSKQVKWYDTLMEIKGISLKPLKYYISYQNTLQGPIIEQLINISTELANRQQADKNPQKNFM